MWREEIVARELVRLTCQVQGGARGEAQSEPQQKYRERDHECEYPRAPVPLPAGEETETRAPGSERLGQPAATSGERPSGSLSRGGGRLVSRRLCLPFCLHLSAAFCCSSRDVPGSFRLGSQWPRKRRPVYSFLVLWHRFYRQLSHRTPLESRDNGDLGRPAICSLWENFAKTWNSGK